MALIDVLRKKQQELAKQSQPTAPSVQQMQESLATGATGKVTRQAGPAVSGIGQQIAQQQAQVGQQALEQQQQLQAAQLGAGIEQQQAEQAFSAEAQREKTQQAVKDIAAKEKMTYAKMEAKDELADMRLSETERSFTERVSNTYANRLKDLASERNIAENNLFSDYRREVASLDKDKQLSRLSQLGHDLAMADKRYVATIQQAGALARLNNDLEFKREANRLAFGKNLEILSQSIEYDRILEMDQREFARMMADISIEDALEVATNSANSQMMSSVMNSAFDMGKSYYDYSKSQPTPNSSTDTATSLGIETQQNTADYYDYGYNTNSYGRDMTYGGVIS